MWVEAINDAAPSEDMAGLNDGDIKRIDARIAAASALQHDKLDSIAAEVALLKPRGWKKALHFLREWSVLGVTATIIIALLGTVVALVIAVSNRREADAIFRTNANNFQERTGERLARIEASLLAIRAKAVASAPPDSENQAEARNVLAAAKKESIQLPMPEIERGGQKFIEAAMSDPKAWQIALQFVAYRSVLNEANLNVPVEPYPKKSVDTTHYKVRIVPGKTYPNLSASAANGPDTTHASHWDAIGQDQNKGKDDQPLWLFARGGAISLDGEHIRNVFFIGVEIQYSGAPVILENVTFINCVFVFENNDPGRKLGRTLLASANINFQEPA